MRGGRGNLLCPKGACTARIQAPGSHVFFCTNCDLPEGSHELIIGLDFLRKYDALISYRADLLTFVSFTPADC